jgi:phage repressor protein C with HTH and peptisase S24 domain
MKHEDIWRALDTLAAENGLSASGLARRSGLDPTTFNPSKRCMPDGRFTITGAGAGRHAAEIERPFRRTSRAP